MSAAVGQLFVPFRALFCNAFHGERTEKGFDFLWTSVFIDTNSFSREKTIFFRLECEFTEKPFKKVEHLKKKKNIERLD